MLALRRLTLSHFRSYLRAELDPAPGLVAFYGPNGAGKTNLLEAISLLSPGRGMRRAQADAFERQPEGIGWKVSASLTGPRGDDHDVATGGDAGATTRSVRIDGKVAPQLALGRITRMAWLTPAMDRIWTDAAGERRAFLDRLTMGLDPGHAERVLAFEKAMRERNRLLRDEVRDARWYDAVEAQLADAGAAVAEARRACLTRLVAAQEGAATAFPRADLEIDPGEGGAVDDAAGLRLALADGRSRDMAAGRTLSGPHRADLVAVYAEKAMPARHCSTGEQKALLVSLVLAGARAVATDFGAPPILLLDEIAAHLDADRRVALYRELTAMGAQAFMSGTGAELFADAGPEAMLVCVRETGGQTTLTLTASC